MKNIISIKTVERNLRLAKAGRLKEIPPCELIEMLEKLHAMMLDPELGVGQRLRFYRKQAGLSRVQLGAKAGVSWSSLQRYEEGVRIPKHAIQERIANILNIRVQDLWPRDTNKPVTTTDAHDKSTQ